MRKSKLDNFTKEEIEQILEESATYSDVARKTGIDPSNIKDSLKSRGFDFTPKKNKMDYYSKEELEKIVKDCSSWRELSHKLGYYSIGGNDQTIKNKINELKISTEHFTGLPKNMVSRNEDNIFIKNSTATQKILRTYYIKGNYSPYVCAICGQEPVWNGKPLTLTLDHINGDNHDDRLENLRWVCPNCDRQLPTFAGKNIKNE